MSRKRKTVGAGNFPVTAPSATEHLRLEKRIRRGEEKLRKRYREIHGKTVDWVSHSFLDGSLYIGIRFEDETHFSLRFSPQFVHDDVHLADMSQGDYGIVRQYRATANHG